eukprot:TRINITY_DN15314_c0_g1_i1.p1 TRINITY_DN15314_c0_g1~~TRINITY_DN15314_c0_g1_i1.p1  ORF type:complete len:836 (+),score=214.64 TRINITY_DN15314_c0_g1_i1:67-2508(+)
MPRAGRAPPRVLVPSSFRKAFAGLDGVPLYYFRSGVQVARSNVAEGGRSQRVVVIAEGALCIAREDGTLSASCGAAELSGARLDAEGGCAALSFSADAPLRQLWLWTEDAEYIVYALCLLRKSATGDSPPVRRESLQASSPAPPPPAPRWGSPAAGDSLRPPSAAPSEPAPAPAAPAERPPSDPPPAPAERPLVEVAEPDGWVRVDGSFLEGADALPAQALTLAEAVAVCEAAGPLCAGFCFRGAPGAEDSRVKVYFRDRWEPRRGAWTSYRPPSRAAGGPAPPPAPSARSSPEPPPTTQSRPAAEPPAAQPDGGPAPSTRPTPALSVAAPAPAVPVTCPRRPTLTAAPGAGVPGARRAVLAGCRYAESGSMVPSALHCVAVAAAWLERRGWELSGGCTRVLTDANAAMLPTRHNVEQALQWLGEGAQPGDALFLYLCGHGGGLCYAPKDFDTAGVITDEDVMRLLVWRLPVGCRLTIICDFCCGGALLDLPHSLSVQWPPANGPPPAGSEFALVAPGQLSVGEGQPRLFDLCSPPEGDQLGVSIIAAQSLNARCGDLGVDVVQFAGVAEAQTEGDCSGALTAAYLSALNRSAEPTYSELMADAAAALRQSQWEGPSRPALRVSSARPLGARRPFHLATTPSQPAALREAAAEDKLLWVFSRADRDCDGLLSKAEMDWLAQVSGVELGAEQWAALCAALGADPARGIDAAQLRRAYRELGAGSGLEQDYTRLRQWYPLSAAEEAQRARCKTAVAAAAAAATAALAAGAEEAGGRLSPTLPQPTEPPSAPAAAPAAAAPEAPPAPAPAPALGGI